MPSVMEKKNLYRNLRNEYISDFQKENAEETVGELLLKELVECLNTISKHLNNPKIAYQFLMGKNIKKDTNVKEVCIENRKTTMEAVVAAYKNYTINADMINPEISIDTVMNIVNNYYDAFYLKYSKDKDIDSLPAFLESDLLEIKSEALKEIKLNVGIEGIKNNYAKNGEVSFAKYCLENTTNFVKDFNEEVTELYTKINMNVPDKVTQTKKISRENLNAVRNTAPTYLNMLTESYNSRSKIERFFSYFPFVNKAAKEERNAIAKIEGLLKNTCLLKLSDKELNDFKTLSEKANKENYYQKELDLNKSNEKEQKVEIIVSDASSELVSGSINKVSEIYTEKVINNDLQESINK